MEVLWNEAMISSTYTVLFSFQEHQLLRLGSIIVLCLVTAPVMTQMMVLELSLAHVKQLIFFYSGKKPVECLMWNATW